MFRTADSAGITVTDAHADTDADRDANANANADTDARCQRLLPMQRTIVVFPSGERWL